MQIYVEYALLDNFVIDYILLKSSLKCARVKSSVKRQILASLFGALCGVLLPLINCAYFLIFIIKIISGMIIVLIGGKYVSAKTYFLGTAFFFSFTAITGGFLIALFNLAKIDYNKYFLLFNNSILPISLSIALIYFCSKIVVWFINSLSKSRGIEPFVRKCEIVINGKKLKVSGFIDSGNNLYERSTGMPIIISSKNFIKKLYENKALPNKYKTVEIFTVSGIDKIKVYEVDKLLIYNGLNVNIYNNVWIGEGSIDFSSENVYELLLHSALFK